MFPLKDIKILGKKTGEIVLDFWHKNWINNSYII